MNFEFEFVHVHVHISVLTVLALLQACYNHEYANRMFAGSIHVPVYQRMYMYIPVCSSDGLDMCALLESDVILNDNQEVHEDHVDEI